MSFNFNDIKKLFIRKPKNTLEGTENSPAPAVDNEVAHIPDKLVEKCEKCGQIVLSAEMEENFNVCPKCGHYKKMTARARIGMCAENFSELFADVEGKDILDFPGYAEKIAALREKTGEKEGVVCGTGEIGGVQCFVLSGGARMQEGIVSLMQMAKTSAAVAKHGEAGLLYVAVLTDPTTGGVSASFAFDADIILAEKGALIGFAGPRVIEQTIRQKLPEGFQRSELLQEKGFVDRICERKDMKETLAAILKLHCAEVSE